VTRRFFFCFGIFALISTIACLGNQPRLAIVGPPELDPEIALLTVALSRIPDIMLLERSDIDAVLKEQSLTVKGLTLAGSVRLGTLLKADGILLLEKGPQDLGSRLVAVESGAVMGFDSIPYPIEDLEGWANLEVQRVSPLMAKLKIPRSEIVPLSLMRITALLNGLEIQALAKNLDFLLAARLSANPFLVVLERARLEDAAAEKGFGTDSQPFWSSGWILEGSVSPSSSGYALEISLQPPSGPVAYNKVEAADLNTLVELVNKAVLKTVEQKEVPWNLKEESQRFFEEGRWASRNSQWEQAAQAFEAAVALGDNSPETLDWRWRCYEAMVHLHPRKHANEPSPVQFDAMARAIGLYREIVLRDNFPKGFNLARRFPIQSQSSHHGLLKSPGGQGAVLLSEAGVMISKAQGRSGQLLSPEAESAVARLRQQMHGLFDAMEDHYVELTIRTGAGATVRPWASDPPKSAETSDDSPFQWNIHTDRVANGLTWEVKPEQYAFYLKKCLSGEIAADPVFFQHACVILDKAAGMEFFLSRNPQDVAFRAVGSLLAGEHDLRLQTAGAILLCRTGAAVTGMEVFEQNRDRILNGDLPADFTVLAMRFDPMTQGQGGGGSDSIQSSSKALGILKDIIVFLLNNDHQLSDNCWLELSLCRFNQVQAADLLRASQAFVDRMHVQVPNRPQAVPEFVLKKLRRDAGESDGKPVAQMSPNTSRSSLPIISQPNVEPLKVDLAWLARNVDDPSAPGAIRYVDYVGGKIWLQVEYPASKYQPARREILTLAIPSLEKSVILRDKAPPQSNDPFSRGGPTFASDGENVFVWNGRGIDSIHFGESKPLETPELSDPRFWLIERSLFVASAEGTLLKIDPASGQYEIVASQMRRPPQTKLDPENELKNVQRIYRTSDGSVAALLPNMKVFLYRDMKKDWDEITKSSSGWRPEIAEAVLQNCWNSRGVFLGEPVDYLLTTRPLIQGSDKFGVMSTGSQYLQAVCPSSVPLRDTTARTKTGLVSDGELWMILEDLTDSSRREWLFRMRLSDGRFGAKLLDFSPQYQASIQRAHSTGGQRLIPTTEGLAIYTTNEPVLWYIPATDLPAYDHP